MNTEEYTRYLRRLQQIVVREVVPKTAVFDYFSHKIYDLDEDPQRVEPLIWYIQSGLLADLTFSIYRLYDKRSQKSILDFTHMTRLSLDNITWMKPLSSADLDRHDALLESVDPICENLRKRRNKLFAHYDSDFFFEPDRVDRVYPFSTDDAKRLVRVLQKILADHSRALDGSVAASLDGFAYAAAEKLYGKLRASVSELVSQKGAGTSR
ncbi:MAG: hypothetical protein O3A63_06455 [Proteobacteria bacterium]|nr:hypothetical protein [Pseudomonadota bacterium]